MKSQILKFDLHLKQTNEMDQSNLSEHKHSPRSARLKRLGERQPFLPLVQPQGRMDADRSEQGFPPLHSSQNQEPRRTPKLHPRGPGLQQQLYQDSEGATCQAGSRGTCAPATSNAGQPQATSSL